MNRAIAFAEYVIASTGIPRFGKTNTLDVDIPDHCPMCGHAVTPIVLSALCVPDHRGSDVYTATLFCQNCSKPFIAQYSALQRQPVFIAPKTVKPQVFDARICNLSAGFVEAYNQSLVAESMQLNEIAGMGYRKSIEYLIKDYLILRDPDAADSIRAEALGAAINNRISNDRLKLSVSRAVWLGNDFTHYTRKYSEYEISSMKTFIDAAQYWILMELITDEAENMDRR